MLFRSLLLINLLQKELETSDEEQPFVLTDEVLEPNAEETKINSIEEKQKIEADRLIKKDEHLIQIAKELAVKDITGKKPKIYKDYRKLLENKDIDAVVIGTPDHWHCLNLVDALHADKHIYCEKPISNSIEEADIMLKASVESKKCVQVGQWQRSGLVLMVLHPLGIMETTLKE